MQHSNMTFGKSLTVLLTIILSVAGELTCKTHNDKAICTIEETDSDSVLRSGVANQKSNLAFILLRSCKITAVEPNAFQTLFRLAYLDLSDNKISEFPAHVLQGSQHIRLLNLSHNRISQLDPESFELSIEILDLSHNRLKDIPLGFFAVVADIKNLILAYNKLESKDFNYLTFQTNNLMVHFDMSGADLEKGLEQGFFYWATELEVLKMDKCSLFTVPNLTRHLSLLKRLTMASNFISRIESVETFVALINLETLDLSDNRLQYIDPGTFTANDKLKSINLRKNMLTSFDETLFQGLPMLGNLDLAQNHLRVVSANAFRETPLKNLNLASNRITYLPDNFCLELRNSKARLEKFYFHDNPWQCKCLNDIMREVKKYEIKYNNSKYDGKHPVCVMKKVYSCLRHASTLDLFAQLYDNAIENYALNNL